MVEKMVCTHQMVAPPIGSALKITFWMRQSPASILLVVPDCGRKKSTVELLAHPGVPDPPSVTKAGNSSKLIVLPDL